MIPNVAENRVIYLDYNASTPLDPAAREAMLPYLADRFGNSHSSHALGRPLHDAVEKARSQVASLLGANAEEILFTSGGTESNNHVIKGVALALREQGRHIITSTIEHPAVSNPCRFLESQGFEISWVPVDATGRVDPRRVAEEVRPDTILISIMHANNEVGTVQDIAEISAIAREGGVLLHTDAAQSCGKIDADVKRLGVDFLSVAAHKLYGPQGVGALYVRSGCTIEPLHHGAGHQSGRRAGTEPVALIVGLGVAAERAGRHLQNGGPEAMRRLCDRFWRGLQRALGDRAVMLGHPQLRLPNTLCVGFRGVIGGELLAACPAMCASSGSACHSGKAERSATLAAMDIPEEIAFGAVRFSVGRHTMADDVDRAIEMITRAYQTRV